MIGSIAGHCGTDAARQVSTSAVFWYIEKRPSEKRENGF
jgi:hypothetical protein